MVSIVNESDLKILLSKDKIFQVIHSQYGPPPNWQRPQGFITLSRIILEQQVSLESAKAHYLKLNKYIPEFTPFEILKLTDKEMRTCQISRQKSGYLRTLSKAIIEGTLNLEALSESDYSEVRHQLKTIKGIGDWTSDIYQIFCLQAKDVFPTGDVALISALKDLSNANTREDIHILTETWKPLRSLAAFYLWHHYLCKRKREVIY
jgi:DNA-3-methyladenine glycosylase II